MIMFKVDVCVMKKNNVVGTYGVVLHAINQIDKFKKKSLI